MKKIPLLMGVSFFIAALLCVFPASAISTPVAAFAANATSGTAPLAVLFLDESTNAPTSWVWSFGDGGISTIQSPVHAYTLAGTYTVTLTVTNSAGSNTVTQAGYVTVTKSAAAPVANFVATVTSGTSPLPVQFVDSSTNAPTTWLWSFGDGGSSTLQNPSHMYTTAGTYTVTLTATNAAGSNTISQTGYITVSKVAAVPAAAFEATATSGNIPLAVQFVDSSANTPTSWVWSFGDGGVSNVQDPSHTYTVAGTYTVTLTATNTAGSNTVTETNYITVSPAIPVASFTANITTGPAPLSVSFTDTSTNSPTNWSWSFGDGGTSSDQNIVYTYTTAGAYSVGLTAYNSAGSNVTTESDYIVVNSGSNLPGASFTSDVTQGSVPLTVQFTDKSTNVPTSWAWSFGDGNASTMQNPSHTYTSVGTYAVALTATNADGSNTLTQSGYITVSAVPATTVQAMTYATTTTVPELTPATTTSAPAASETSAVSGSAATSAANGSSGMLILVVIIILIVIAVVFLLAIRKQNRGSRRSGGREL